MRVLKENETPANMKCYRADGFRVIRHRCEHCYCQPMRTPLRQETDCRKTESEER